MSDHPQKKAVVIDSRLRSSPEEGKSIALFFLVEQHEVIADGKKVNINMEQRYTACNVKCDIQIPLKKNEEYENVWKGTEIPQVLLLCHDRPTPNVVQWSGPPDHTT